MFGLPVEEKFVGYVGWRAILHRGNIDILSDRTSGFGEREVQGRLLTWVNKPRILPPPPRRKRPRKVSPWKSLQEAAKNMSGASNEEWELREGSFVLRASPCGSYGYLYIALFELDTNSDEELDHDQVMEPADHHPELETVA
jgi:hypothetical protein